MTTYEARLGTFTYSPTPWPHASPTPQPENLAAAGFNFIPTKRCPDQVECTECKLKLDGWEPTDNAVVEHIRRMPKCMTALQGHDRIKECVQAYEKRLATFTSWPHASPQPIDLARAGFEFAPSPQCPDKVRCDECLGYLGEWEPEDTPILEHIRSNPHCKLAKKIKEANEPKTPSTPQSLTKEVAQPVAQPKPKPKLKLSKQHEQQSNIQLQQPKRSMQALQDESQSHTVEVTQPLAEPTAGLKAKSGTKARLVNREAWQMNYQQGLSREQEQQSKAQLQQSRSSKQDTQQKKAAQQTTAQDPKQKPTDNSTLTSAQTRPTAVSTSSTRPKLSSAPITPALTPAISAAIAAVAETSTTSHPITSPPASYAPAHHDLLDQSYDTETEPALAKADVSEASPEKAVLDVGDWVEMKKAVLDVGDWVELEIEEEEKDDWVQV